MAQRDTSLARGASRFPSTPWSAIVAMRDQDSDKCRDALNDLLKLYWRPVYKYIRVQWAKSNEDAKDLTQEFFAHLCDKNIMVRIQATRGRFRSFLKTAVDNFIKNDLRASKAQKRGGDAKLISLDFTFDDNEPLQVAADEDGETIYNKEWIRTLFEHAVAVLEERYTTEGKKVYFQIFNKYDIDRDPNVKISYNDLAKEFGVSYYDVVNYLSHARARFRETVLELVKATTPEGEVDDEVKQLFGNNF